MNIHVELNMPVELCNFSSWKNPKKKHVTLKFIKMLPPTSRIQVNKPTTNIFIVRL